MRLLAAFLAGSLFGLGIVISGMANPAKVVNFFDITGHWDPSLAFVMGSALMITFVGYRLIFARGTPLLTSRLELPTRTDLDTRLLMGSATFGVGWGIAGFCPGAAIPTLSTGYQEVFIFTAALVAGILIAQWARVLLDARKSAKPA
jgi:uncharacterized membrane protein YedE/YeeE